MFYHHLPELVLGLVVFVLEPHFSEFSDLPQLRLEHFHKKYPNLRSQSRRRKSRTPLQLREHSVYLKNRNGSFLEGRDKLENLLGFYGAGYIPHDLDTLF